MIIMTAKEYIRRLQVLAKEPSYYDNTPGQNLLYVHQNGVRSGDCSNTIKALLNGYDVTNKTPGYFQSNLSNTGDVTTEGLLWLCSDISGDFTKLKKGYPALLHMMGHVGTYLGKEVTINGNVYNVIECTAWTGDWGHTGIIYSYVDRYGRRFTHKGGWQCMSWTFHGLFTPWLDYGEKPVQADVVFTYQTYDDIKKIWLPNVQNASDYAGNYGNDIDCLLLGVNKGSVRYALHTWKGDQHEKYPDSVWLPEVKGRKEAAGRPGRPADAVIVKSTKPAAYRVHLRKEKIWLPWVRTKKADYRDPINGYAGNFGSPIDAFQIKPTKK